MKMSSQESYDEWHRQNQPLNSTAKLHLVQWHEDALQLMPPLAGRDVLEVGCGGGDFSFHLAGLGARVVGTDFSDSALAYARDKSTPDLRDRVSFQQADAQNLPFADGSFDVIVSCECLEHVPEPRKALSEMARVLRPGGRLILTTENYSNGMLLYWAMAWIRRKPFNSGVIAQPIEHFFLFWRVIGMIKEAGFHVEETRGAHFVFFALPGMHPHAFVRERIRSTWLSKLLFPFARHVSFMATKA